MLSRPSQSPRVKPKGPVRWANDLARALEIPRQDLCKELGSYDCFDRVHRVALGGVEPYSVGLDQPLEVAPVTAAIAADRVALMACQRRIEQDVARPAQAVLLEDVQELDASQREAFGHRAYRRLLGRDPSPQELEHLEDFWRELEQEQATAAQWALLSCFSVASSMEALFY